MVDEKKKEEIKEEKREEKEKKGGKGKPMRNSGFCDIKPGIKLLYWFRCFWGTVPPRTHRNLCPPSSDCFSFLGFGLPCEAVSQISGDSMSSVIWIEGEFLFPNNSTGRRLLRCTFLWYHGSHIPPQSHRPIDWTQSPDFSQRDTRCWLPRSRLYPISGVLKPVHHQQHGMITGEGK